MPIDVHIVHGGKGRVWRCRGTLTGAELIANNERVFRSKSYEGVRWLLIDQTDSTLKVSPDEIRTIRQQDNALATVLPEVVTAVVVASDYAFGMARMWELLTERPGWSTRAFRSRAEAEAWLRQEVQAKFQLELPADLNSP